MRKRFETIPYRGRAQEADEMVQAMEMIGKFHVIHEELKTGERRLEDEKRQLADEGRRLDDEARKVRVARLSLSLSFSKIYAASRDIGIWVIDVQRRRCLLDERETVLTKKRKRNADALKRSNEALFKVVRTCFECRITDVFSVLGHRGRFDAARTSTRSSRRRVHRRYSSAV